MEAQHEYLSDIKKRNEVVGALAENNPEYSSEIVNSIKKNPAQLHAYLEELASSQEGYEPEGEAVLATRELLKEKMLTTNKQFEEAQNELKMTPGGIAASQAIADDKNESHDIRTEAQADAIEAANQAAIRKQITDMLNDPNCSDEEKRALAGWALENMNTLNENDKKELLNIIEEDNNLLKSVGVDPDKLGVNVDPATHERIMRSGIMQKQMHYEFQTEQAVQRAIANEGKLALKQLTMKQALSHGLSREQYEKLLYKRMMLFKRGKLTESKLKFRSVMGSAINSWMNRRFNNVTKVGSQSILWSLSMTEKLGGKLIHHMTGANRGATRHHGSWKEAVSNPEDAAFKRSLRERAIPRIMAQEAEDMVDNVHIARSTEERAKMSRPDAYERAYKEDQKIQERLKKQTERVESTRIREAAKQAKADAEQVRAEEAAREQATKPVSTSTSSGPTPDQPER